MIFELYSEEVEITLKNGNKQTLKLVPLSGRFLPKLYSLMDKMQGQEEGKMNLDEETTSKLHFVILETLKSSYPEEDANTLDKFASQNLLQLMEGVIKVNFNNTSME